ncbi:L-histidine N(alpha)-methyltransferase, partial [Flavobacteriales bacterium]|nr:L-histidine N(alpha)-methyltransferase [Flavobacteriales bacterium]
ARFNLNVLTRINRELGGEFDLEKFEFYSYYNPDNGDVRSYLVSLENQDVFIEKTGKSFQFVKDETIWMELSKKYPLSGIEQLGRDAGFKFELHFLDSKNYFSDSLYTKP